MNAGRRCRDGSEMVAAAILAPLAVALLFGLVSLNLASFQGQLIEAGVNHATDTLGPELLGLDQRGRDEALRQAIMTASPLLARTAFALEVRNTQVETLDSSDGAPLDAHGYARAQEPWQGDAAGHVDSHAVRVTATVTYHTPPLLPGTAWHAGQTSDEHSVHIDRLLVLSRREEVT